MSNPQTFWHDLAAAITAFRDTIAAGLGLLPDPVEVERQRRIDRHLARRERRRKRRRKARAIQ